MTCFLMSDLRNPAPGWHVPGNCWFVVWLVRAADRAACSRATTKWCHVENRPSTDAHALRAKRCALPTACPGGRRGRLAGRGAAGRHSRKPGTGRIGGTMRIHHHFVTQSCFT
ncbi:hypothetical protein, partial [Burkholderia multivorans]|uniref:hypothetical protein n=1 Tax=Burkholderia multivorans TaxID=87883 RepID=UPI001EE66CC1